MSDLEDRLRDAYRGGADTVAPDSVPDVPRPGPQQGRTRRRPASRGRTWAVPLMAAAAVTVIAVTAAVAVPRIWPGRAGRAGQAGGGTPVPGGLPRFFVAVMAGQDGRNTLQAFSTATGRRTGELTGPRPGLAFQAVAAVGSDRTFVAEAAAAELPRRAAGCDTWLYRFRLTSRGGLAGLTPLTVPEVAGYPDPSGLAASADGKSIAYATETCTGSSRYRAAGHVGVLRLSSGSARTWNYLIPAWLVSLSLSADGRLLAFVSDPSNGSLKEGGAGPTADWTLATSSAAGPLQRYYHKVIGPPATVTAATLNRAGTVLFADEDTQIAHRGWRVDLGAYQRSTGRLIRALPGLSVGMLNSSAGLSLSSSTRYLLLYGWTDQMRWLDLSTGRLSTVPGRQDVATVYATCENAATHRKVRCSATTVPPDSAAW